MIPTIIRMQKSSRLRTVPVMPMSGSALKILPMCVCGISIDKGLQPRSQDMTSHTCSQTCFATPSVDASYKLLACASFIGTD